MSIKLYYHPLSSYSWKALIAFYENDVPYSPVIVDQNTFADFKTIWPLGKFPVIVDEARDQLVPEASLIVEYLDQHRPGKTRFIPADPDRAREVRLRDRFYDNYVMTPMQKLVSERLRPLGEEDPYGANVAKDLIAMALDMMEADMASKTWAAGDDFTLADCAAGPSLFYADKVAPFGADRPVVSAYLARLTQRPSFARVLEEAQPYFHMFPQPRELLS
jgi:glutathione S-transferase